MSFIKKHFKMKFISIILIVASVAVIGLCLTMVVASDAIVEQHQQMSGNTINRRDSAKLVFIKNYITETGDISILKTLGKSITNALLPDASITGSGGGGKGKDDEDPPGGEPLEGLEYQPITVTNGMNMQKQSSDYWDLVIGDGGTGTSVASGGCYLFTLAAYGYDNGNRAAAPGSQLEDCVYAYAASKGITVNIVNGKLSIDLVGGVGQGQPLCDYAEDYFGFSGEYTRATNGAFPDDITKGKWILYYNYPKKNSTGSHWVYVKDGKIANPNSGTGNSAPWSTAGCTAVKYKKVG